MWASRRSGSGFKWQLQQGRNFRARNRSTRPSNGRYIRESWPKVSLQPLVCWSLISESREIAVKEIGGSLELMHLNISTIESNCIASKYGYLRCSPVQWSRLSLESLKRYRQFSLWSCISGRPSDDWRCIFSSHLSFWATLTLEAGKTSINITGFHSRFNCLALSMIQLLIL